VSVAEPSEATTTSVSTAAMAGDNAVALGASLSVLAVLALIALAFRRRIPNSPVGTEHSKPTLPDPQPVT
jgi:hypothetical protein